MPNVTKEHLEKFRLSLLDHRKKTTSSFYVLYLLPCHGFGSGHVGFSSLLGSIDSYEMGTVFTPGSVRNIFYPAITPKNSTKTISTGTLGKFSIDAIEKGHRKNIRIHALGFPGTFRTVRAHDYNITLVDATGHDANHQAAISYFPEHLYHMSLHCLDVIRKKTNIKWSEELWPLIDMFVIDSNVSVLNQKNDPNDHSFARTYSIDETLSDSQCQQWMVRLLKTVLSAPLFNIILHDMITNKSTWEQWIDVDNFVKNNTHEQFNQALQKPLTINELTHAANIQQQIIFGFITNWQSITDSILGKLIHFEKNDGNKIFVYLFGEPIGNYSNDELKIILTDIDQNNLAGIELINSAASGDIEAVKKIIASMTPSNSFDYILLALRMAAKHGQANCVEYILNNNKINKKSAYYQRGLEDAVAAGHKKCVELLLDNIDASCAEKTIHNALLLSVKRRKPEIVDLLLEQNKYKIPGSILVNAIASALDHDDAVIAKKIFLFASKNNKLQSLIDGFSVYKMLRSSPANCISIIIDSLIGHSNLTYQKIFTAIAKSGSVECANEFINYINKQYEDDDIKRNKLLMECMLEGFSSINPRDYFTQPVNLHHDIVKLQINQYLKSSAFNQMLLDQNQFPKKNDIKQLIEKIFSTSFKNNDVTLYTLSDIALHNLISHPVIKENQELNTYCLNTAIDKAIYHQEPYYLRLLLRAGGTLTFSYINDNPAINGILIKDLPSSYVKCLLWLTHAINEIKQFSPNDLVIKASLKNAELCSTFEKEMFSLIYGNSAKINIHTLRCLAQYFGDENKFTKIKQLIVERVEFLQESDLYFIDQSNITMFNKSPTNLSSVATDKLIENQYQINMK